MIPYGKQSISEEDIAAVVQALRSDYLTQGSRIDAFEAALCRYTGARYCVVVSNGTAALHLAMAALQLEPGSEGITSPITFAATANAMHYCGIAPVFADIDTLTGNLCPTATEQKISEHTRLLVPVHFAGQAADMTRFHTLAQQHNLTIIEDAAHAIGSCYTDGSQVGNCRYSKATIFSFHPVKTITTAEGGAIMTNDPDYYARLRLLRSHGITKDEAALHQHPGPWYHEMQALGWNYRLTDLQAALGLSQLQRLDEFKARRQYLVERYNDALAHLPWLATPVELAPGSSCFHLYVARFKFTQLGKTRTDVMQTLQRQGIGSQVHYIPVYHHPWYQAQRPYEPCQEAEHFYQECLSLPLYPTLTDEQQDMVIAAVRALDCGGNA
ncbi:UDP-4-amino-4,6-dideoxy-N-acetyl-beta-L-altrosamine transaminase [Aeromonas simiae]|uniref:UDP-4-amino-4, 6-dideoxy-N-acetyl-beta-L-altrosamine transaminase n=1 Tax=Aeromonas simiae TaxID=218936 RepID=UPI0038CFB0E4